MGENNARDLERRKLYEEQKAFAEKVGKMLEEHLEYRRSFRVYTPDRLPGERWIWGLGPDLTKPYKTNTWIDTVWAYPDEKIYMHYGSCDVDLLISEQHPRVYDKLIKETGDPKEKLKNLHSVMENLQFRENWSKYRKRLPKVIGYFRECERIAEDASKRHNAHVEFWVDSRHCGIRAVVDTAGMDEDERLKAIMKAAEALKDFDDRLSETEGHFAGARQPMDRG